MTGTVIVIRQSIKNNKRRLLCEPLKKIYLICYTIDFLDINNITHSHEIVYVIFIYSARHYFT